MKKTLLCLLILGLLSISNASFVKCENSDKNWIPHPVIPEPVIPEPIIPKVVIPEPIIPKAPDIPEIDIPEITIPGVKVRENDEWALVTLSSDILFDFDKDTIRPDAYKALNEIYTLLIQRYQDMPIRLHGHTDSKGTEEYNMDLSKRRVNSVKKWFVRRGIPERLITTHAYGESMPVAPNTKKDGSDNPEGRRKNRRVEIYVHKIVGKERARAIGDNHLKP
ncbi:OmpA family protein [Thermodesulfobacteriota bacterium B35]